jgi:iron complex transport system ATP-binding protein
MNCLINMRVQGLSLKIGKKTICEDLSFEVRPGEIIGILGQNGSGKTTLLNTLAGLNQPQAGKIYLGEMELGSYSPLERARLMGILFQENQPVFPQQVWDYCMGGRYPHRSSLLESQRDQEVTFASLSTMKLTPFHRQNILTLSGGEWRRLAIATLLAQDPSIYLLDEPLNHLDMRHQMKVMHYFQRKTQDEKISAVMVLHDLNMAQRYCDRVLMLYGNKTVVGGKELLTEENLSGLYGYPVCMHGDGDNRWWMPERLAEEA